MRDISKIKIRSEFRPWTKEIFPASNDIPPEIDRTSKEYKERIEACAMLALEWLFDLKN